MMTDELPFSMKVLLNWLKGRIKTNKNAIIIVNGPTGSGKSYSCISLADECSKLFGTNFNIQDNLDFNFTSLLEKMQLPQNTKPGTCFVFEEVGAFGGGASAREWQSKSNKFFFSFMQTSRHRNQIVFLNCPNFSFLELGTRSLVHFQMQTAGINFRKKVAYLKPYRVQVNSRSGKFYFKYVRFTRNNMRCKLNKLEVPYPNQNLVDNYEVMKLEYTTELNKAMIAKEKKKVEVKEPISCPKCKYEWIPRAKAPKNCPRCKYFLNMKN